MNKIEGTFFDMRQLAKQTGMTPEEIEAKFSVELEKDMKEKSYKKGLIENLVNYNYNRCDYLDVGELTTFSDYSITTCTRTHEGEEFISEEEYGRYVDFKLELATKSLRVTNDDDEYFLMKDGEALSCHGSQEDAQEAYDEELESIKEEYPEFDELEVVYDEVAFNTVYGYDSIDEDIAQKCGLGVLKLNDGSKYLFLTGCGMDMSYQLMRYEALAHKSLSYQYLDSNKLGWMKQMLSDKDYNDALKALGVDTSKLTSAE